MGKGTLRKRSRALDRVRGRIGSFSAAGRIGSPDSCCSGTLWNLAWVQYRRTKRPMKSERSLARNSVLAGASPGEWKRGSDREHSRRARLMYTFTSSAHALLSSLSAAFSGCLSGWKNTGFSGFGSCTYEARHCGQQYMTSNHRVAGSSPASRTRPCVGWTSCEPRRKNKQGYTLGRAMR